MNAIQRAVCVVVIFGLTGFLLYAFATGDVIADQLYVWKSVWGVFVWADVYAGFALFSTIVHAFERRLGLTLALFLLACCAGNIVNAAWLLWRGPDLLRRFAANRQATRS